MKLCQSLKPEVTYNSVHAASKQQVLKVLNYKHCCYLLEMYKHNPTPPLPPPSPPATHAWIIEWEYL